MKSGVPLDSVPLDSVQLTSVPLDAGPKKETVDVSLESGIVTTDL